MTKLIRTALIVASLFTMSFAAQADDTDPQPQPRPAPNPLYGSFCSAAATDGLWGFVFNRNDIDTNCDYLQRVMAGATRAPIYASNSGLYLNQGWNEAVATCGVLRSYFTERGALALQRAYDYARVIGGQGCIFEVYFYQ